MSNLCRHIVKYDSGVGAMPNGGVLGIHRRCYGCQELLPLGPATITPDIEVEIRAAELAVSIDSEPAPSDAWDLAHVIRYHDEEQR